jgi:thymidine kinase
MYCCNIVIHILMPNTQANEKKSGRINLILGCMWSGKTSELFRRYERYIIGGKKCLMIKYENDTRYSQNCVSTHGGKQIESFACAHLYQADNKVKHYDVVCIDEIQFFKDGGFFVDKWANSGLIVECSGLNGTFRREPFEVISNILPLVDSVVHFSAICKETGNDALYSDIKDLPANGATEIIGGDNIYRPVDRDTYIQSKGGVVWRNYYEFGRIYCKDNQLEFTSDTEQAMKKYIDDVGPEGFNIEKFQMLLKKN